MFWIGRLSAVTVLGTATMLSIGRLYVVIVWGTVTMFWVGRKSVHSDYLGYSHPFGLKGYL